MDDLINRYFAFAFPFFFVGMWLVVTTVLSRMSGWPELARRFPDRPERPLLQLRFQSGSMGRNVSFGSCLNLAACPSGLRVGLLRIFGPFSRDFFVPWNELNVERTGSLAKIRFGRDALGMLKVSDLTANRLALASPMKWPETGPVTEPSDLGVLRRYLLRWLIPSCFSAVLFIVVTRVAWDKADQPPIAFLIAFPALAFGIGPAIGYVTYLLRRPRG